MRWTNPKRISKNPVFGENDIYGFGNKIASNEFGNVLFVSTELKNKIYTYTGKNYEWNISDEINVSTNYGAIKLNNDSFIYIRAKVQQGNDFVYKSGILGKYDDLRWDPVSSPPESNNNWTDLYLVRKQGHWEISSGFNNLVIATNSGSSFSIPKYNWSSEVELLKFYNFSVDGNPILEDSYPFIFENDLLSNQSGNLLFLGLPNENFGSGKVIIYKKNSNDKYTLQQSFEPSFLQESGLFGKSIALNHVCDKIIIGAPNESVRLQDWSENKAGAVYVLDIVNDTITDANPSDIKFFSSYPQEDARFGHKVKLNKNGNIAIVSAIEEKASTVFPSPNEGAVYVFSYGPVRWNQMAKITGGNNSGPKFGEDIYISDENIIFIGAPEKSFGNNKIGSVYIFSGSEDLSSWTKVNELTGYFSTDYFGASIQLNDSENILAIGAPNKNLNNVEKAGAVYVFTGSGIEWKGNSIIYSNESTDFTQFGKNIALSAKRDILFAGAKYYNYGIGNAYVSFVNPYQEEYFNNFLEIEEEKICHNLPKYITGLNFEIPNHYSHKFIINLSAIISGFYNNNLGIVNYNYNPYLNVQLNCGTSQPPLP
jgi:hypothetical protein